jgi:hypothetical protein
MNKFVKIVLGLLLLGAVSEVLKPTIPPKPVDPARRDREVAEYAAKEFAQRFVKAKLRDPSSAVFGPLNAHSDRKFKGVQVIAVCGTVNAKNGFGGYTGMKQFVSIPAKTIVVMDNDDDNSLFANLWNSLCAGKHQ